LKNAGSRLVLVLHKAFSYFCVTDARAVACVKLGQEGLRRKTKPKQLSCAAPPHKSELQKRERPAALSKLGVNASSAGAKRNRCEEHRSTSFDGAAVDKDWGQRHHLELCAGTGDWNLLLRARQQSGPGQGHAVEPSLPVDATQSPADVAQITRGPRSK